MAKPVAEYLVGGPITFPMSYDVVSAVVYGTVESATAKAVTLDYYGVKLVLRGSFEIDAGGQVLSGTMTGFDYSYGGTKLIKGSGYSVSYADLSSGDGDLVGKVLLDGAVQKGTNTMDYFYAWSGDSVLLGRGGNDWLFGNSGNDRIKGGDGDDFISGYEGRDTLWGGAGKDVFAFNLEAGGPDRVEDFQVGKDTILLGYYSVEDLGPGYLSKGEFVVGSKANADRTQVIYDKKTGVLYYDQDGLGAASKMAICELAPKLDLKASDIFVGFWS